MRRLPSAIASTPTTRAEKTLAGAGESRAVQKSSDADSFFVRALSWLFSREIFLFLRDSPESSRARSRRWPRSIGSFTVCPVVVVWPGLRKLRRRISTGERPTTWAMRSMWRSSAKRDCGAPKSAERAMRRRIGGDGFGANADAGPIVRAAGVNGAARENDGRKSFVGAAVDGEVNFSGENFAVFAHGSTVARSGRMALGRGSHIFHAVIDNFHRFAGLHGEKRGMCGDHRGIFFLAAKSAAGFHLHNADAICGQDLKVSAGLCECSKDIGASPRR